jgi:hypothetical protein
LDITFGSITGMLLGLLFVGIAHLFSQSGSRFFYIGFFIGLNAMAILQLWLEPQVI